MKYFAFNFVLVIILPFNNHGKQLCNSDIRGQKGEKGDIGNCGPCVNNSTELNTLTRVIRRGYMKLDDGWISPFNGYQYKVTLTDLTWQKSQQVCQSWGGELVVYGVRDFATRIAISRALAFSTAEERYWIGLSDITNEGQWLWVNGHHVSTMDVTIWQPGQPDNYLNEDCGFLLTAESHVNTYLIVDEMCSHPHRAVCEKLIA